MARAKVTTEVLRAMKQAGEPIAALTAYDHLWAGILDSAGIDVILVGDSVGTVVQGRDTTISVTMEQMLYHTEMVTRGTERALVIADMPFMSFQVSLETALRNAGDLLKEGNAEAVKLEGGIEVVETVRHLTEVGIPVMGHLGLTPQSIHKFGSYKVRGLNPSEADRIFRDAQALQDAGVFALVLEKVPGDLARRITEALDVQGESRVLTSAKGASIWQTELTAKAGAGRLLRFSALRQLPRWHERLTCLPEVRSLCRAPTCRAWCCMML